MSSCGHVGKEDAHLTVLHPPSRPAVLLLHAGRVAAPFGKAAFIQDQHWEERIGLNSVRLEGRRAQRTPDEGAQIIANPLFLPDGTREQALYAIGSLLFGLFSNLPAIFSGDVAENGLQIEQGVLAWLRASEVGSQALMQLDQGQRPSSYLAWGWSSVIPCGMVMRLHAVLVVSWTSLKVFFLPCRVSHREREMHEVFSCLRGSKDQVTSATVVIFLMEGIPAAPHLIQKGRPC